MNQEELFSKLRENPGYIKKSVAYLQNQFNASTEDISHVLAVLKLERGINPKKSYNERLEELGLKPTDVKSVKFWESMNGENRFSIQTKTHWYENKESVESFYKHLKEELTGEIEPVFLKHDYLDTKRALFIYTADKHVGAKTSPRSVYKNDYTAQVFEDRMMFILKEVGYLAKLYGKFDRIYLVDLGDPLDGYSGYTTRGGHKLPQNLDNREQFDTYVSVHKKWFDNLVEMNVTNDIYFSAVTEDNHSGAFGYCANRAVETYLNVKYPTIHTKIMSKFIEHTEYGEHAIMFSHGKDSEDMKQGFPKKLDAKTEAYINDYIDHFQLNKKHCHFVKGDLHQEANEFSKRFRYKNVLSLYGASKWIHTNFGTSKAGACFEVIEKHSPRVHQHSIVF
jgi:hypothetical protein